jgi:hypothetical protein
MFSGKYSKLVKTSYKKRKIDRRHWNKRRMQVSKKIRKDKNAEKMVKKPQFFAS